MTTDLIEVSIDLDVCRLTPSIEYCLYTYLPTTDMVEVPIVCLCVIRSGAIIVLVCRIYSLSDCIYIYVCILS